MSDPVKDRRRVRSILRDLIGRTMAEVEKSKLWQWIDSHVVIPLSVGSPNPGPMKTDLLPHMRGLWDLLGAGSTRFFTFAKSARIGGTLFCICAVLEKIARAPGPVLWVDPSRKSAMRFSRAELQPHLLECEPVKDEAIIDRTHWTTTEMHFKRCTLGLVGAGSAVELAGRQAEMIVINESDKIPYNLRSEAPPHQLAIVRSKQYTHTRKIIENSTPTVLEGRIWGRFLEGSQHYCYLPCTHCGVYQRLTFFSEEKEVRFGEDLEPLPKGGKRIEKTGRFKFDHCRKVKKASRRKNGEPAPMAEAAEEDKGQIPTAHRYHLERVERETVYECAACGEGIAEVNLNAMLRKFRWVSHNPDAPRDHISAHCWAGYSPFEPWGSLAAKFLRACGNPGEMHDFYNSDLGLPFLNYASRVSEKDIEKIQKISPNYRLGDLPLDPALLTMTVDVQGWGFWWTIWAWGVDLEHKDQPTICALIDYGQAVNWAQIEQFAGITERDRGGFNEYSFKGEKHTVTAGLIDSGFEAQSEKNVYDFCLRNQHVFSPSKGGSRGQLRGNVLQIAQVHDNQLDLIWYWDDFFKQHLYHHCIKSRKHVRWLPRDLGEDAIEQFTDEHTEPIKLASGQTGLKWKGNNNHLGDCWKMNEVLGGKIEEEVLDAMREKTFADAEEAPEAATS